MKKISTLMSALLILSACATQPIDIATVSNPAPSFEPVMPAEIVTAPIHWTVITQTQIKELAAKDDSTVVFYALDPTSFENLADNMTEIQRYMQEQKSVILTYHSYYSDLSSTPEVDSKQ